MWKFIQRKYYEWVIRNCERDIRELEGYAENARMGDSIEILCEIQEIRGDLKRARAKLSTLNA